DPRYGQPQPGPTVETRIRPLLEYTSGSGVFIAIDKVQNAPSEDLAAVAQAFQNLINGELPVALAFAGLTVGTRDLLDLPGTTFSRPASAYDHGSYNVDDTVNVLPVTADSSGITFDDSALPRAAIASFGYHKLEYLIGALVSRLNKVQENDEVTHVPTDAVLKESLYTF